MLSMLLCSIFTIRNTYYTHSYTVYIAIKYVFLSVFTLWLEISLNTLDIGTQYISHISPSDYQLTWVGSSFQINQFDLTSHMSEIFRLVLSENFRVQFRNVLWKMGVSSSYLLVRIVFQALI